MEEVHTTPLDKYEGDELADAVARKIGLDYFKKKNKVIFSKDIRLLKLLGIKK